MYDTRRASKKARSTRVRNKFEKAKKFNLFVVCGHFIVGAVLLGSGINNGFIVDTWFRPVFGYGDASWVGVAVAIASGLCIGLGAYGLFIHSERALKTILRLPALEAWIRGVSLVVLNVGFVALGIAGLDYRLSFLNSRGVGFLLVIGVILECSTPIFGIVMQPLQNPATEVMEEELLEKFERRTISESYGALEERPINERFKALKSGIDEDTFDEAIEAVPEVAPRPAPRRRGGVLSRRDVSQKPTTNLSSPEQKPIKLPNPDTQPLTPTDEVDEVELMQRLMKKYGEAPFLQSLQSKNRA